MEDLIRRNDQNCIYAIPQSDKYFKTQLTN